MTAEERKNQLKKIQEGQPCMTGITLTYHGERQNFDAYKIPLEFLTYNQYNGRIGSTVKSYERQNHPLDIDNPKDIKLIEKFLWESKESANKNTVNSLLHDHQQRYGIVTADGKIIDGNRRACLLNKIWHDETIDPNIKQHCKWFIAIVLPIDADKKELLRLETTYQMGEDAKVDYEPIEKYLKCDDLIKEGFSTVEVASFMGASTSKTNVEMYLRVLKLMNEYLETYGYDGMYTMLDNAKEDSFQKFDSQYKQYLSGSVSKMWDYSPETDTSDLKTIAFDYIRLGLEQQDFRDISRLPSAANSNTSIFSNKLLWEDFSKRHYEVIDTVEEESVTELIEKNPTGDINRILRARDNKWRKEVGDSLNNNFKHNQDKLQNFQQADKPLELIKKALEALSAVDIKQDSFKNNQDVLELIKKISTITWEFKKLLEK